MVRVFLEAYAGIDSFAEGVGINEGNEILAGEVTVDSGEGNQEDIFDLRTKSQQQHNGS